MKKHTTLIAELSSDLAPVSPRRNINLLALAWFVLSAVFVVAITRLVGPMRPGFLSQLATEPRFLLETLMGVMAILWISLLAFRSSVPAGLSKRFAMTGLVLMALWLGQYVIGFVSPALEPSGLGKRDYCYVETLLYALPVIVSGLFLVRRLYPLRPVRTALSVGLVAGMLPALVMQLACMYEPTHIMVFHVLPGLLMVAVSAVIARWWSLR